MELNKYQVTIHFTMDDHFMGHVPKHRMYIKELIDDGVIDYYAVSMESKRTWMIVNAMSKLDVEQYLANSPLFPYWTFEIDELFVYDGQTYRLPAVQLN
jgi:muconolactone delta-isomerase